MTLVPHRNRVYRTNFRKLASGAPYWVASTGTASAPLQKYRRGLRFDGWTIPGGAPILTQVTDSTVAVIRVPEIFTFQNEVME